VDLEISEQDNPVCIHVTDTGKGIPEEDLPYIWERFYKVEKARTRWKDAGAGIGLSNI
jgi:two-component system sensor histidine kinase ResE